MKILLTILITSLIIFLTVLLINYSSYNGNNKNKYSNEKDQQN